MVVKVGTCSKTFAALPADVGLKPQMYPSVSIEGTGCGEAFIARFTDVRLFS